MDNDLRFVKESHLEMTFDSRKTAGMLLEDGRYATILYFLARLNMSQTEPEREYSPILYINDLEIS